MTDRGTLLVIETTDLMKPRSAWVWLKQNGFGKRNWILLLWAWTRVNGSAVNPADMDIPGYRVEKFDVFEGMVSASLISQRAIFG